MARIVAISGTDTGVGKTRIACGLAEVLCQRGLRIRALKPFESGCSDPNATGEDGRALAESTGQSSPRAALLRFREAVAPAEAADCEGRSIDFEGVLQQIRELAVGQDLVLVEGAGGLLAPLTWRHTLRDLMVALDASCVLVGWDRLGTINHTLLTWLALEQAKVPCLGLVLNTPEIADASSGKNAQAIQRLSGIRRVHVVPHTDQAGVVRSLQAVAEWLDRA